MTILMLISLPNNPDIISQALSNILNTIYFQQIQHIHLYTMGINFIPRNFLADIHYQVSAIP